MKRAVIFALDGLRGSVFQRYLHGSPGGDPRGSALRRCLRPDCGGAFLGTATAKSIFPSYTLPAWAAAFTGNSPRRNGIVGNTAFYRDLGDFRRYDSFGLFYERDADAIRLYGWEWNYKALPEIACQAVTSFEPLSLYFETFPTANVWIWAPHCWFLGSHPWTFWLLPHPHRESGIDFYHSGGIQNGDLLVPTLYDYAKQHGLKTYVSHQFYNRTLCHQRSWADVYDGRLRNMDRTWGRPSYKEIRDLGVFDDYRGWDRAAFEKGITHLKHHRDTSILTIYSAAIDHVAHKFRDLGASLDEVETECFAFVDTQIGWFMERYEKIDPAGFADTVFFLIGDHGLTENDLSRQITGPLSCPGHSESSPLFKLAPNSSMAHLYVRSGNWRTIPAEEEVDTFVQTVFPRITFERDGATLSLQDHTCLLVSRYGTAYTNLGMGRWHASKLRDLSDLRFGFVDGAKRLEAVFHRDRAGDLVLITPRTESGHNTGFSCDHACHGSLWPDDTHVPFYVWGTPLRRAFPGAHPVTEASITDLTPTVMNYLGIYRRHADEMEGTPLFDERFRPAQQNSADLLLQTVVLDEHLSRR